MWHRVVGSCEAQPVEELGAHAGRVAAVDDERVAGDERRVVGREEQRGGRDLLGPAEAAELVLVAVLVGDRRR